ncbi:hypothetical protein AALC17_14685 [Oscillospiraceae bacterium 38-13]
MSETVELRLYSPLQVDIIDRDALGRAIPFQAVSNDCRSEYARIIMNAFRAIQPQEDARNAFIAPEQDWSEICEKIISLTRTVEAVDGTLYGVYTCRSSGVLDPEEIDDLPYPSFRLTNNNASIRQTKKRIEELTRRAETEYEGWTFDGGTPLAGGVCNPGQPDSRGLPRT